MYTISVAQICTIHIYTRELENTWVSSTRSVAVHKRPPEVSKRDLSGRMSFSLIQAPVDYETDALDLSHPTHSLRGLS